MIKLIGITGKARAGKDTLAQCFVGMGYEQVAFAKGVKDVTAYLAGEAVELFYQDDTKEAHCHTLGMTRRRAMQNVGNAMREAIGDHVWVEPLLMAWRVAGMPATIVSDVRYPNEAQAIRDAGGIVIQVLRPSIEGLSGDAAAHISEAGIPPKLINYTLLNNGTLDDLAKAAAELMAVEG